MQKRWVHAKKALNMAIDHLPRGTLIKLVFFNDTAFGHELFKDGDGLLKPYTVVDGKIQKQCHRQGVSFDSIFPERCNGGTYYQGVYKELLIMHTSTAQTIKWGLSMLSWPYLLLADATSACLRTLALRLTIPPTIVLLSLTVK